MNVVVAYMSYSNTTRRSELLNGLWHMGLRQYPVIGDFGDVYMRSLDDAYAHWTKKKKPCIYHGTHSPIQAGRYDYT